MENTFTTEFSTAGNFGRAAGEIATAGSAGVGADAGAMGGEAAITNVGRNEKNILNTYCGRFMQFI